VDIETFTFKIAKLHHGANESTVNLGSRCLQSVDEQLKVLPAPAATALDTDRATAPVATKENIHKNTIKILTDVVA
jgi:hypothetical protein